MSRLIHNLLVYCCKLVKEEKIVCIKRENSNKNYMILKKINQVLLDMAWECYLASGNKVKALFNNPGISCLASFNTSIAG